VTGFSCVSLVTTIILRLVIYVRSILMLSHRLMYFCLVFCDVVSFTAYIGSNGRMKEVRQILKDFGVSIRIPNPDTIPTFAWREAAKSLSHDSRCPDRDSN
jgi:hypothetical protein